MGPKASPHPSSQAGGREMEWGGSRTVLNTHCWRSAPGAWNHITWCLGRLERLESKDRQITQKDWDYSCFWRTGTHNQPLQDKKRVGTLKDFPTVRGVLKGQGLHRASHSGERIGGQNHPGTMRPSVWELSGASGALYPWLATIPRTTTMIYSLPLLPAGTDSQTYSPRHCTRPA